MTSEYTPARLRALITKAGYKNYTPFARKYGMHRHTIRQHLSGMPISPLAAARYEQIESQLSKGRKK